MTTQTIHITKPELVGSEKQIKWANDIINNIISILGEIEIPAGATKEQIAQVQKIVDTFFAETKSSAWIEHYKKFTAQTPKKTVYTAVMVGWYDFEDGKMVYRNKK